MTLAASTCDNRRFEFNNLHPTKRAVRACSSPYALVHSFRLLSLEKRPVKCAWYRLPLSSNRANISSGAGTLLDKVCDTNVPVVTAPSMQSNVTVSRTAVKAFAYLIDD
jgi:hypothetical protein